MNADINGAANIGRKYDKRIFPEGMDCRYLYGTVKAVTHKDILCASRSSVPAEAETKVIPVKRDSGQVSAL